VIVKLHQVTEALRKKQRQGSKQDETQFGTKNGGVLSLKFDPPALKANVPFCRFFFNLTWFWTTPT
jgi:hypothetical protein